MDCEVEMNLPPPFSLGPGGGTLPKKLKGFAEKLSESFLDSWADGSFSKEGV